MSDVIAEILFSITGRIVLYFKYRNKATMRKVCDKEYAGYYSNAGRDYLLSTILIVLICGIVLFLLFLLGMSIYRIFI